METQTTEIELSPNALEVLKQRYLLRDDKKQVIEAPEELFRRAASHIASAEASFSRGSISVKEAEEHFYRMMRHFEFLPNSPTLMNAGTSMGQLSACFVVPVEDSIEAIFKAVTAMAQIHQTGGGTGFAFSRLRPKGDLVYSTKGEASGPVSFMSIFDQATGVIVQGGRRRGANMGVLRCDHPDIIEFIQAKLDPNRFTNFNLSVGITDAFMEAYKRNQSYKLVNPRTEKVAGKLKARYVFDLIAKCAWKTGDPGLVFLDEINRRHPLPALGAIETTNPCGELPLLPYESCNLGSINLSKMVKGRDVDWTRLADCVKWGIRFLDNVIEINKFPAPEIREATLANRKIGLGVMGFADLLIQVGIPYDSKEAIQLAGKLMRFIHKMSVKASLALATERGVFSNFERSIYKDKGLRLRNATLNSIAPTGTISIIAGCSSGIEPLFAVSYVRNVLSGTKFFEVHPLFEERMRAMRIYFEDFIRDIAKEGSIQKIRNIPASTKRLFKTAFEFPPAQHLRIQAAFQRYTDNAVSKTINLPKRAAIQDVKCSYQEAYRLKCKGITVYRYGSRKNQVLSFASFENGQFPDGKYTEAEADYSGGCAKGLCGF